MEQEKVPIYTIREATVDDVEAIRRMHAQSWCDTYQNDELGVTGAWLKERTDAWLTPEALEKSKEYLSQCFNDPSQFYRVALLDGAIVGFIHAITKEYNTKKLDGLYTDKSTHGTGLGSQLMELANEWFDDAEVELQVASYNERAKNFYRKWGFEEVSESESAFDGLIPEVTMVRKR